MPSTQKGLVAGLSVCDRDSVVICTWSALSTHLWCHSSPHQWDRMGRNDSRRHNECVQLLIHLSPSNVAPVEMIQPLRPAEMRMLTCMVVRNSCEGVGKRRGGGVVRMMHAWRQLERICMYGVIRGRMSFLVVCSQMEETYVTVRKWVACSKQCPRRWFIQTLMLTLTTHCWVFY